MEKVTTATGGEVSGGGGFAVGSTAVLLGMLIVIIGAEIGGGGGSVDGSSAASLHIIIPVKDFSTTWLYLDLL
jgi:hypothetical protein